MKATAIDIAVHWDVTHPENLRVSGRDWILQVPARISDLRWILHYLRRAHVEKGRRQAEESRLAITPIELAISAIRERARVPAEEHDLWMADWAELLRKIPGPGAAAKAADDDALPF